MSSAIADAATWSGRLILIALAGWGLLRVMVWAWPVVFPVILALFITSLLWPVVRKLRAVMPDLVATLLTTLVAVVAVAAVVALIVPRLTGQWDLLVQSGQQGWEAVQRWAQGPPLNMGPHGVSRLVEQVLGQAQGSVSSVAGWTLQSLGVLGGILTTVILSVVLAFLMLKDGLKFLPWLSGWVSPPVHAHAAELGGRLFSTLSSYLLAQTIVALVDAVFIGLGLFIIGVPLALVLAVFVFVTAYLPVVGAFLSGLLAVLVAFATNGVWPAVAVLAVVVAVQQLEGNLLSPWLVGKSMKLHGAVVLAALALGAATAGIVGAFLAVPIVSALAVTLRYGRQRLAGDKPEASD